MEHTMATLILAMLILFALYCTVQTMTEGW